MQAYAANGGLRVMANRKSGNGLVWAVWGESDEMMKGAADVITHRSEATTFDISFGDVSFGDIVLTEPP
jgi:hypothetical protein